MAIPSEDLSEFERELTEHFENVANQDGADATDDTDEESVEAAEDEELEAVEEADEEDESAAEDTEEDEGEDEEVDESGSGEVESAAAGALPQEVTLGDRTLTTEQVVDYQRAYDFAAGLSPDQVAAINMVLSGQYTLVPVGQEAVAPPSVAAPPEPDEEPLDPALTAEVATLRAEIDQMRQVQAEETNALQAERIRVASEAFAAERELTNEARIQLEQRIFDSGSFPGYVQAANGDVVEATINAMETAYWSDPDTRQKAVEAEALAMAEQTRRQTKESSAKKRKAGSLSSSGGSVSRRVPQPSTKQELQDAMVAEIANAIGSGQAG